MKEIWSELIEKQGVKGALFILNFLEEEEKFLNQGFEIIRNAETQIRLFNKLIMQYKTPNRIIIEKDSNLNYDIKEKKKILFVEDDLSYQMFFKETGNILGYSTQIASDGVKALEVIESNPPDLIITDFKMPNLNGINLARKLKQKQYLIPSLLITGFPSQTLDERIKSTDIKKILYKPIRIRELKEAIEDILK